MSFTTTTNYGFKKPDSGTEIDTWGNLINSDLDGIDTELFNKYTKAQTDTLLSSKANITLSKVRAYFSGSQSLSTTWNPINLNTKSFDLSSEFNTGTYKFTVLTTGYYQVNGTVAFDGLADYTAYAVAGFYKNGITTNDLISTGASISSRLSSSSDMRTMVADFLYLIAGDWLRLGMYVNLGSGLTVRAGAYHTYFSAYRVM